MIRDYRILCFPCDLCYMFLTIVVVKLVERTMHRKQKLIVRDAFVRSKLTSDLVAGRCRPGQRVFG